jgi:hypothetical protein
VPWNWSKDGAMHERDNPLFWDESKKILFSWQFNSYSYFDASIEVLIASGLQRPSETYSPPAEGRNLNLILYIFSSVKEWVFYLHAVKLMVLDIVSFGIGFVTSKHNSLLVYCSIFIYVIMCINIKTSQFIVLLNSRKKL